MNFICIDTLFIANNIINAYGLINNELFIYPDRSAISQRSIHNKINEVKELYKEYVFLK